jgi:hypothetical protein
MAPAASQKRRKERSKRIIKMNIKKYFLWRKSIL